MFRFDETFREEFKENWPSLLIGFTALFFGFSAPAYALPFLYPEVIQEFGWDVEQATFLSSVKYFTGAITCLVVGRLLDVTGVWIALILSIFIGGLALLGFLWVESLSYYYFLGVLLGIAGPGAMVSIFVLVARSFKASQGTATGIALLGTGLGGVVMPLLTAYLIGELGWRMSMAVLSCGIWFIALPLLLYGLLRIKLPSENDIHPQIKNAPIVPKTKAWTHFLGVMRGKNFWFMAIAFFTITVVDQALTQHQVLIFGDLGISTAQSAFAISGIGLFSMIGRIIAGNILDTTSNKGMAILYTVMGMTAALAFLLTNPVVLIAYVVFRALSHASVMIDGPVIARHCYGNNHLGLLLGIFTAMANLGSSAGPWIMARLFAVSNSYDLPLIIFVILSLFSATCMLFINPVEWKSERKAKLLQTQ
ncbi:MFS transporter [Parasphingorhabdus cellanae]|uniref:MFS transporter n=1 Tax=Parasphingorhabdus cellanae TaxID=2806553 RepID=A0ABX7T2R4_9SPHN|nr:MFS transporter [Parasphingorhabdus cellanae]QTD55839.1 MFS transporter [Parasphingorhabdus cellanae]